MSRSGAGHRRRGGRVAVADRRGRGLRMRPSVVALEERNLLSTFTVTSTADNANMGTLRWAVGQANQATSPSVIDFNLGSSATIALGGTQLELSNTSEPTTIAGPGASLLTVSGNHASRVFRVDTGVTALISGLTITGGSASTDGGGLSNSGTLALEDSLIINNVAGGGSRGGGVYNNGTLSVIRSTLEGNSTGYLGGGIFNLNGSLFVEDSTLDANTAGLSGGGIDADGSAGATTIYGSTFTLNVASSPSGGGGAIDNYLGNQSVTVEDTVLAGDSSSYGPEFSNSVTSLGSNLVSATNGSGGWVASDKVGTSAHPLAADLGALGYYGGPTPTIPLLVGSQALGAGVAVNGITADQRGLPLDSPSPDIGAFQTQAGIVVNTASDFNSSPLGTVTLRQAINLANALGAAEAITFDPTAFGTPQTITLTMGALDVDDSVTITGPSAGATISGNNQSQVFVVGDGVHAISVTIAALTIAQGYAVNTGGNTGGGGILNNANSSLTLLDDLLSNNVAGPTANGGGVYNAGTLVVTNSTFYGDTASYSGGGIMNVAMAAVTSSTFVDDSANNPFNSYAGGAISTSNTGATTLNKSLMFNNGGHDLGVDVSSTYTTGDYNWSGDYEAPGAHSNSGDPLLGPLGNYGGPTETIPLLPGSLAIGAGGSPLLISGVSTDQRGLLRGGVVDIGAFQSSVVVESSSGSLDATPVAQTLTLPDAVGLADRYAGLAITFDHLAFAAPTTITLGGTQLELSNTALSTSITGPVAMVTVSGGGLSRDFLVDAGATATIADLTVAQGMAAQGGGIENLGTLTLTADTISGNTAQGAAGTAGINGGGGGGGGAGLGGGLFNEGTATVTSTTFVGNAAIGGVGGGAVYPQPGVYPGIGGVGGGAGGGAGGAPAWRVAAGRSGAAAAVAGGTTARPPPGVSVASVAAAAVAAGRPAEAREGPEVMAASAAARAASPSSPEAVQAEAGPAWAAPCSTGPAPSSSRPARSRTTWPWEGRAAREPAATATAAPARASAAGSSTRRRPRSSTPPSPRIRRPPRPAASTTTPAAPRRRAAPSSLPTRRRIPTGSSIPARWPSPPAITSRSPP